MRIKCDAHGWGSYQTDWMDDPLVFGDSDVAEVDDPELAQQIADSHKHLSVVDEDNSESGTDAGDEDGEAFDAESFVDRTPMSDVVEDIESGDYDDHLEAIDEAASREGVKDAVDARQEDSG